MRPRVPKCEGCGVSTRHVVPRGDGGHEFLCGDCEYRRDHPNAPRATKLPSERRAKPLQKERLWDP